MSHSNRDNDSSPFWEGVFESFRHRTYQPEPPMVYDFQIALDTLRKRSGMTMDQLCPRLGVLPSAMATLESRNGASVRPDVYLKLRRLALDYELPKMAVWFGVQEDRARRKRWRNDGDKSGSMDYGA